MITKANIGGRLETTTAFIKDLLGDIQKGEIKIPQFQRKFVWKKEQALKLLDSISNNYPAGSVLLWRTHTKLAVERNIGDFKLPKTDDHSPTDYVLDGQQRITVIYSCLGAPPDEEGFAAGYDLDEDQFCRTDFRYHRKSFPDAVTVQYDEAFEFPNGASNTCSCCQVSATPGRTHRSVHKLSSSCGRAERTQHRRGLSDL